MTRGSVIVRSDKVSGPPAFALLLGNPERLGRPAPVSGSSATEWTPCVTACRRDAVDNRPAGVHNLGAGAR